MYTSMVPENGDYVQTAEKKRRQVYTQSKTRN